MAVYTPITFEQLNDVLADFEMALSGNPEPVAEGIENSTYFFCAVDSLGRLAEFVLTIVETCPADQAKFAAVLTRHLNDAGLPVPCPVVNGNGDALFQIAGKQALILPRIDGTHPVQPELRHCRVMGDFLARAHLAGAGLEKRLANRRGLRWLIDARFRLAPRLSAPDCELLDSHIAIWRELQEQNLPRGPTHGDLFRDNALFQGDRLVAVIDFFNACDEWLLFDVAIAVNDWCRHSGGLTYDTALTDVFLGAYNEIRPFCAAEAGCWRNMLTLAACRFWISRLLVRHADISGEKPLDDKDPQEYRNLLAGPPAGIPGLPGGFR